MTRTYRLWTPEEDALLTKLYAVDTDAAIIANRLKRTKSSCRNRARIIGLSERDRSARVSSRLITKQNKNPEFVEKARNGRIAAGIKRRKIKQDEREHQTT